ncbi:hypothetical protein C6P42_005275, partial [Pichia californica]
MNNQKISTRGRQNQISKRYDFNEIHANIPRRTSSSQQIIRGRIQNSNINTFNKISNNYYNYNYNDNDDDNDYDDNSSINTISSSYLSKN